MKHPAAYLLTLLLGSMTGASEIAPADLRPVVEACAECHDGSSAKGGLDITSLKFHMNDQSVRDRWMQIHDRVQKGEMPPRPDRLPEKKRAEMVALLAKAIHTADEADVRAHGRGPMRRLNRDEYEQNLRDVLKLPNLDIRDMLPEDQEGYHSNKFAAKLDISRVQLAAFLESADAALRLAMATGNKPQPSTKFRAVGAKLFAEGATFGEREAMFFAKNNKAVDPKDVGDDPSLELALFRSAHWPYYGYPKVFLAQRPGDYKVRFSARAVLQSKGYTLKPALLPVPMTFRARKPSGPDVSGDVRATGGLMDIPPETSIFETTIRLRAGETFEYSLLGLPVPLARNVQGGPPTYRYPPFPEGGQPGVAFQWLEVEGPLAPEIWPPPSYRVLFDSIDITTNPPMPNDAAKRLLRRFVKVAAREPVSEESLRQFEQLIVARLQKGAPFHEAMLAGYQAFLCSGHFLYLKEPMHGNGHYAIASRLSHFLANTRPDASLLELAELGKLCDTTTLRHQTERLIAHDNFNRFVTALTDYWLDLRHLRRDDPDIRLYPEYRFDDYCVESMGQETRAFVTAMVRDNLPVRVIVSSDFIYANDSLAKHYGLPPLSGSAMRKIMLPNDSRYGGLLTQASIMKVTSNGTTTSPVVRGAWIMDRLMGQPPPPPPPSVPAVEPDIRGAKTIRELLALHTQSKTCASCHAKFDPVGLALENFDVLGRWRTRYRGVEQGDHIKGIDRAGHDFDYTLTAPVDSSGTLADGQKFNSITDLKKIVAANPRQLARNLLHQFTVYATGTPVRFSDRPEIESILDRCAATDYRARDLLVAFVTSRIFLGDSGATP
jgi:hypothetical protein